MNIAKLVRHAVVSRHGSVVRIVSYNETLRIPVVDVLSACGVKLCGSNYNFCKNHIKKARIGTSSPILLLSEDGCRLFAIMQSSGSALDFLAWLNSGGMTEAVSSANYGQTNSLTKEKAYCLELLATLLNHSGDDQAARLMRVVESEIPTLLGRYRGEALDDACYELYCRYWLQGGEV